MAKHEFKKGDIVAITYVGTTYEDISTDEINRVDVYNPERVDAYLVERPDTRKVGDLYGIQSAIDGKIAVYQYMGDDCYRHIRYSDGRPGDFRSISEWTDVLINQAFKVTLNYGE